MSCDKVNKCEAHFDGIWQEIGARKQENLQCHLKSDRTNIVVTPLKEEEELREHETRLQRQLFEDKERRAGRGEAKISPRYYKLKSCWVNALSCHMCDDKEPFIVECESNSDFMPPDFKNETKNEKNARNKLLKHYKEQHNIDDDEDAKDAANGQYVRPLILSLKSSGARAGSRTHFAIEPTWVEDKKIMAPDWNKFIDTARKVDTRTIFASGGRKRRTRKRRKRTKKRHRRKRRKSRRRR